MCVLIRVLITVYIIHVLGKGCWTLLALHLQSTYKQLQVVHLCTSVSHMVCLHCCAVTDNSPSQLDAFGEPDFVVYHVGGFPANKVGGAACCYCCCLLHNIDNSRSLANRTIMLSYSHSAYSVHCTVQQPSLTPHTVYTVQCNSHKIKGRCRTGLRQGLPACSRSKYSCT